MGEERERERWERSLSGGSKLESVKKEKDLCCWRAFLFCLLDQQLHRD